MCAGSGGEVFEAVSDGAVEVGADGIGEDVDAAGEDVVGGWAKDAT